MQGFVQQVVEVGESAKSIVQKIRPPLPFRSDALRGVSQGCRARFASEVRVE